MLDQAISEALALLGDEYDTWAGASIRQLFEELEKRGAASVNWWLFGDDDLNEEV